MSAPKRRRSRKKHADFIRDAEVSRGKREVRDEVFSKITNTSYVEQRNDAKSWIHAQIQECKTFCDGLEPCAKDNVGTGIIAFIRERLNVIEGSYDKRIMGMEEMTEKERKALDAEIAFRQLKAPEPEEEAKSTRVTNVEIVSAPSNKEDFPSEYDIAQVEKVFHGFNMVILPIVRELKYLREMLDYLYEVTP